VSTEHAVAYSYVRFSTPEQAEGDSLRRQTAAAAAWCARHKVILDTSTTLHDLGRSAYTGAHRKNPDRHALASFLKLVEAGKVPRGSYLIIENLDRLSREHIQPALLLALNLLQAGVRIVQLKPAEMVFDDKSDTLPVMMMMMELSRGHGESAMKSERNGAKWQEKLACARAGKQQPPRRLDGRITRAITARLPEWIEERGGEMCLIPERAAAVKRIFQLTSIGYGLASTLKQLKAEGFIPWGPSGKWRRGYVASILKSRRALGEYQPRGKDGKPDGALIPDYFPAVVTEEEWLAARAAAAQRRAKPGRLGKRINVFSGLLRNARDGDTFYIRRRARSRGARPVLVNSAGAENGGKNESFPADVFEHAVLSKLAEIDPREILNGDDGPDDTLTLASARLAAVETSLAALSADMDEHGESPTLMKRVRDKEAEQRELVKVIAEARQKASHPASEVWGEFGSLAEALEKAPDPDDARLRLRACLRHMIDSVWLLLVPRRRDRLACVQIWFAGGKRHRDYVILARQAMGGVAGKRPAEWWVRSVADVGLPALDMRKRADTKRLERALLEVDIDGLQ
jgi:DNA invertase Pin-like site-specific DNA recombinase